MKILFYGSNGWIGGLFKTFLMNKNILVIDGTARVDDTNALINEIDTINPTHIVSFIGRTSGTYINKYINNIDYLEQPGNLTINIRDNLFTAVSLALLCKERGLHFTYMGTGCIYNYDDIEHNINSLDGFTETDIPNFFGSSYSVVKGFTDRLMHQLNDTVLNLRIRMPITSVDDPKKNFISKIIRYPQICSIPNSMTVLDDFFPVFYDLMLGKITGTFNCTNPGVVSHNEILEMYRATIDSNFTWQNFSIEDQDKILAAKRSNNRLDTSKLRMYNIPDIKYSVQNVLNHWSKGSTP